MEEEEEELRKDEVYRGDIFYLDYYGVNIFLLVTHIYEDGSVEVLELKTKIATRENQILVDWEKRNNKVSTPTGKVELLLSEKSSLKAREYNKQHLYSRTLRCPYAYDYKRKLMILFIGIKNSDPCYKEANSLLCNEGEEIKEGIEIAIRLNDIKSEEEIHHTFFKYEWKKRKVPKEEMNFDA